ncbi:hypothetical protein HanXRQr2_Chr03g0106671 [Helianthus annuus]|uniref:Uncharacterized protein n=1 Tax=Helianthus annuus TaxID=4232 RepID=A0A9K3JFL8_HELAN|nr:hypothetical protein HanXRQr2_Chr03g0106671 [Helianthus annuus]KAJ0943350.1 hypothetical protein HanPSC8_Chr03g0103201 [Helianthus annuus]
MVLVAPRDGVTWSRPGADVRVAKGERAHPRKKKFSAKLRRKSRPHLLEFFVRTPWNVFVRAPLVKSVINLYFKFF